MAASVRTLCVFNVAFVFFGCSSGNTERNPGVNGVAATAGGKPGGITGSGGAATGHTGGLLGSGGAQRVNGAGGRQQGTGGAFSSQGGSPMAAGGGNPESDTGGSEGVGGSSAGGASNTGGAVNSGSGGSPTTTNYAPCPAVGMCKIMPLGDSITLGVNDATARETWGGYRAPLWHLASAANHSILFVGGMQDGPQTVDGQSWSRNHEGYSGYSIGTGGQSLAAVSTQALAANPPNIILLHIGTNDAEAGRASAASDLAALLDQIITAAPDALLVVAKIIPTRNDQGPNGGENGWIQAYNATMDAAVKARSDAGKHIILIDMYSPFAANPNFKTEYIGVGELHPTEAGYAVMGQVWYDAISGLLH